MVDLNGCKSDFVSHRERGHEMGLEKKNGAILEARIAFGLTYAFIHAHNFESKK